MVYVMLNLFVLLLPLALSFDKKVAFYKSWPSTFRAIGMVVILFGGWDVWKTSRGVWSFNNRYVGTWRFLGLPLGEWLFFICVPYACLFMLSCVRAYVKDKEFYFPEWVWFLLVLVWMGGGVLFREQLYTGVVFVSVGISLVIVRFLTPHNRGSRNFWLAIGLTYIPFLITNGILTGLPIVLYDDSKNIRIRLGSIPLEDFLFSLSMVLLSFTFFDYWEGKRNPISRE
ncbi:MAG: lycopene cyclase domain-containing protein [Treponemataceae bacterium]|nr:lycopene cyclase domain-containing protein [Treponemataceae bacterium]